METVKFAFRSLRQTPWFALVAVLALALGIGANSAIFSIVNAIFLKPLPYANPEELVQLTSTDAEHDLENVGLSKGRYDAIMARQDVFSTVAVWAGNGFTLTGGNGDPEQLQGMQVSHEFFPLLGIQPALGRTFTPDEDRPGAERVAIISHALWENRFGARPDLVGDSITMDGNPYTVVGVMPRGISRFPLQQVQVWTPRPFEVPYLVPQQIESGGYYFNVLARLKPGVSVEQAQEAFNVISAAYAQENPKVGDAKAKPGVIPVLEFLVGNQAQTFGLLFAAVGCVLLIACANVANLVLARYATRRKQVAIRFALGAKRRHVIAQFVAENVLLALAGGAVGLLFAAAALKLVLALGDEFVPRAQGISLDPMVLLFTLGVSLATGLVLGLIPALQVSRPDLTDALKDSSRETTGGRSHGRIRGALMVAEVAVSFVLLIAASLLITSFMRVQNVSPGFDPSGTFVGFVAPPPTQYREPEQLANFYSRLWQRAAAIPGARSVALVDTPPLSGFGGPSVWAVVGKPIPPIGEQAHALRHLASPNFFRTIGVRVTRGRDFTEQDTPASPPVVIINEAFAKQAFPGEDPIGKRIVSGMLQREQEVVGVVADTHTQNLTTPPGPEMWYPILQRGEGFTGVLVRTDGDPAALAASVRAALADVDPMIPLTNATTMEAFVAQSMQDRRLTMTLLAGFAGLALVLASLGVYSIMAYSVGQRSGEIGIRMALGAKAQDVQRMVIRHGLTLTTLGVAIGIAGALVLTRMMNALLFGVGASDPVTYSAITALLASVALVACWMPARRAARVDPLVALRSE